MKIPAMVIGFATGQNLSFGFVIVALLFLAASKYVQGVQTRSAPKKPLIRPSKLHF